MTRLSCILLAVIVTVSVAPDFAYGQRNLRRQPGQQPSQEQIQRPDTSTEMRPTPPGTQSRPAVPRNFPGQISENDVNNTDDSAALKNMPKEVKIQQRPANLAPRKQAFQHKKDAAPKAYVGKPMMNNPKVTEKMVLNSQGKMAPVYEVIVDPASGDPPYESPRLRASFVEDANGVRISSIFWGSPLRGTKWSPGLKVGDVIDCLDGLPVNSDWDLENHIRWTCVDYIDCFTGAYRRTWIYIF